MDLQSKVEIRTFGERKPGKLIDRFSHDDEIHKKLVSLGFRFKAGPVFLDTPITIYTSGNAWVQVTERYVIDQGCANPTIGTYYQVFGPIGVADNVIEAVRSISLKDGFEEIGLLVDRFPNL